MNRFQLGCLIGMLTCSSVLARVSESEATALGTTLTVMGAGPEDATSGIPAWQAKSTVPEDEQPLFIITHANHKQYAQHLSAGQVALFNAYPDSFQMPIYPTHRTFTAPQQVYENTRYNATNTRLNDEQTGFINTQAGIPFPIPQSALEVYFNHLARWRGFQLHSYASDANVDDEGQWQLVSRESLIRYDFYLPGNNNRLFSALSRITAPAQRSGSGGLVLEPIDQLAEPRSAWLYDKGRRRVIRAPNVAYDQPVNSADGLRTADDTDMINGSPDRFDWQLLPGRLMYIPYNNDRLADENLKYEDMLQPGHINPQHTRYELHRVWVIRATLKEPWRHLYSRRDFYLDEDSWSVVIADQYDKQDQLFRVSLSYLRHDPGMPGTFPVLNVYHDLPSGMYHVMGLENEAPKASEYQTEPATDGMFTPNGLKRFVR